jgi:glycolate oxidase FAD binding subunit
VIDPALEALQASVRAAAANNVALRIRGGGTKSFYSGRVDGEREFEVLDTNVYAGIIDYEPTELVITARAGTSLLAIENAMQARNQMLGFEPPHFGPGGTLGGAIASGLSGPRRPYAGAVRDFVLGVQVIDGRGEHLSFGGRVMKNVAGFDVSRLQTGALGTLGVITEVSLKCLPRPKAESTLSFACSADEAIGRVNEWGGQPLPLSATCYHQGMLRVRLSGAVPAVASASARLGGEPLTDAASFWMSVRDHAHPFFAQSQRAGAPLWRLSVKSTAPYTDLGGEQLIEWGGALRWLVAGPQTQPSRIRSWAANHGGHATLFRGGGGDVPPFQPLEPTVQMLHQKLKAVFDPQAIFNRGMLFMD